MSKLRTLVGALCFTTAVWAQQTLTRKQAEQLALRQNPQIGSAMFTARAAGQVPFQYRANYLPQFSGDITGVDASDGTRIAAGGLNNPVIFERAATGLTISQLITDFGRTSNLVASANLRAQAANQNTETARARTVLEVDRAYFAQLKAQSVLTVAQETVKERQLVVDQVTALAQSKLKSNLDVSFAQVNLSEAQLTLASAQNDLKAAAARFSAALGYPDERAYELADETMPSALSDPAQTYVATAMRSRPELSNLRLQESAAEKQVQAERAQYFPAIAMVGTAGLVPGRTGVQLPSQYGAMGLNIRIPVFNGGLFTARKREAEFRAASAGQDVKDLETLIARDVRTAFLAAQTAYERVGLTAQMLDQARMALSLAQSRYDIGLGSIVELSQAQLNATTAEIAAVSAKYDYQAQRALLDYEAGINR